MLHESRPRSPSCDSLHRISFARNSETLDQASAAASAHPVGLLWFSDSSREYSCVSKAYLPFVPEPEPLRSSLVKNQTHCLTSSEFNVPKCYQNSSVHRFLPELPTE